METLSRRDFLALGLFAATDALVTACSPRKETTKPTGCREGEVNWIIGSSIQVMNIRTTLVEKDPAFAKIEILNTQDPENRAGRSLMRGGFSYTLPDDRTYIRYDSNGEVCQGYEKEK